MVRAPCCEKMGLKRGPWTIEEDRILINYITAYGHGNWRALPKQAGLLRCGKSCRLRWTNYLQILSEETSAEKKRRLSLSCMKSWETDGRPLQRGYRGERTTKSKTCGILT